jgi:hypothetical protein
MNYSRRDVAIGFIIIILIVVGAFYYKKNKSPKLPISSTPSVEYQKDFEDKFKFDIPDNSNSIELKDVSGGDARGIATEKEILVDVNDPDVGYFYEGWLEKDNNLVSVGMLRVAKGGWLLEYDRSKYEGYKKLIISLEKLNDQKLEKKVLEGTFN